VVVAVALIAAGLSAMEGESLLTLLFGVVPLVLVALVCLCDPCGKRTDSQE